MKLFIMCTVVFSSFGKVPALKKCCSILGQTVEARVSIGAQEQDAVVITHSEDKREKSNLRFVCFPSY
jgi:hypothetical protein